ncbi:MAG: copper resistance protein CopC [Chloroflexi bacterium]|nr:MAG: copper resistance protein CopC [Chloroflexota bacterium]
MTPRRPRRSVAAVALASLCLLVVPTLALGHAELDTANPADKSTVPPPSEVVMTFTEALDPSASSIKLADAGGAIVAQGSTVDSTNTKTMRLELAELAPGNYSVRWTTKSTEDGDIARGTTTFTVIAPTPPPSVAPSATVASSASPSVASPASPSPSPSPSPSGGTGTSTSSTDVLIPIVVALIVLAALGAWLLRDRGRRVG